MRLIPILIKPPITMAQCSQFGSIFQIILFLWESFPFMPINLWTNSWLFCLNGLTNQKEQLCKQVAQRLKAETNEIVQSLRRFHCESMRQFKKTFKTSDKIYQSKHFLSVFIRPMVIPSCLVGPKNSSLIFSKTSNMCYALHKGDWKYLSLVL